MSKGFYIIISLLIVILLIASLGRRNFNTVFRLSQDGRILVEQSTADLSVPFFRNITQKAYFASEEYTQKDYIFWTDYSLKISLNPSLIQKETNEKFRISLALPGKIVTTNADHIENKKAIWEGLRQNIDLKTRKIRWEISALFLVLGAIIILAFWRKI